MARKLGKYPGSIKDGSKVGKIKKSEGWKNGQNAAKMANKSGEYLENSQGMSKHGPKFGQN